MIDQVLQNPIRPPSHSLPLCSLMIFFSFFKIFVRNDGSAYPLAWSGGVECNTWLSNIKYPQFLTSLSQPQQNKEESCDNNGLSNLYDANNDIVFILILDCWYSSQDSAWDDRPELMRRCRMMPSEYLWLIGRLVGDGSIWDVTFSPRLVATLRQSHVM